MRNFIGVNCEEKKPTKNHRPAIWENMLGTVMAMNEAHEVQYFDYDYVGALEFARVSADRNPRLARNTQHVSWVRKGDEIPFNQLVLWIVKE